MTRVLHAEAVFTARWAAPCHLSSTGLHAPAGCRRHARPERPHHHGRL